MRKWSHEEIKAMYDQYVRGGTLRSIGRDYNLSYERVRQLFQEHGLVSDSVRMDSARRYERILEAWERNDEIIDSYKLSGNADAVVQDTGLRRAQVDTVLGAFKQRATYRNRGGTQKGRVRYSDSTIMENLRTAAEECGQPLTISAYNKFADGKGYPTNLTIMNRFGSWHAACEAAGVKANQQRPRRRVFDAEDCIAAIRQCTEENDGVVPSYMRYVDWAKGNSQAPSAPTIRNRLGSWKEALEAAFD